MERRSIEIKLKFYQSEIDRCANRKQWDEADKYRIKANCLLREEVINNYDDLWQTYKELEFYRNPKYGR